MAAKINFSINKLVKIISAFWLNKKFTSMSICIQCFFQIVIMWNIATLNCFDGSN